MKYEWRKHEKDVYLPKCKPVLITIPRYKFFSISGQGNPNISVEFAEGVTALYALSYELRMMPKKGITPPGYFEYTVFPLEGVWDLTDSDRASPSLKKEKLIYNIMIRQPDFLTEELACDLIKAVSKKKRLSVLEKVRFEEIEDGLSVQILHMGSYDDESRSFQLMQAFGQANNLCRQDKMHREIYLSDPRRTKTAKLKTVLRYSVSRNLDLPLE